MQGEGTKNVSPLILVAPEGYYISIDSNASVIPGIEDKSEVYGSSFSNETEK